MKAKSRVGDCLQFERVQTPETVKRFRSAEAGERFIHPGLSNDMKLLKLGERTFGTTPVAKSTSTFSSPSNTNTTVADLIQRPVPSAFQQIESIKAERLYRSTKREMLGAKIDRNYQLPKKFTDENVAFGVPTKTILGNDIGKDILFPANNNNIDDTIREEIYVRSHHHYQPSQQQQRNYHWPPVIANDFNQFRFGQQQQQQQQPQSFGSSSELKDILQPPPSQQQQQQQPRQTKAH